MRMKLGKYLSLGTKTTLILLVAVGAYALLDLAVQRYVVLPSYEELEANEAQRNLARCIDALRREGHHLDRFCEDWSAWDDTLEFVEGKRPQFVDENLGLRTLIANECNFLTAFDRTGRRVWGAAYDLSSKSPIAVLELPEGDWPADHPLLRHPSVDSSIKGMLQTSAGPMLIASRPITASYVQDHIGGTLILGRLLTPTLLNTLRTQTQVDMTLHALGSDNADPVTGPARARLVRGESQWFEHGEPGEMLAFAVMQDVYGKDAFLLRVRLPREITARGNEALWTDALGGISGGALTLVIVVFMMRRIVAQPLQALTAQVAAMAERGELAAIEGFARSDEIGQLARAFNGMQARVRDTFAGQMRAEAAYRNSESRLGSILDAAPDVVLVLDHDGTVRTVNSAVRTVLGFSVEEALGRNISEFAPPRDRTRVQRAFRVFLARWGRSGRARAGEFVVQRRDGTEIAVHVAASLATLDTGPIVALTVRDITELNALHERMARSQRLAEIGQMGASVAHEIRNPIAGISGAAQVLLGTLPPEHAHRPILEEMLTQARRVERTVRQLLGYARPMQPIPKDLALAALAENCLRRLERDGLLGAHRAVLTAEGACVCRGDEDLLAQLINNLAQNAAQAMERPGVITVRVAEDGGDCVLTVEDEGPGFPDLALSNQFEPFNTTKVQGTGLGLAICHAIVEAHGGAILLSNRPGGGACVTVRLPQGGRP